MNHVRSLMFLQPGNQAFQLLALIAFAALQHRERHRAELGGRRGTLHFCGPFQHPIRIENPIHPARRFTKDGRLLLQPHIDSAEEHRGIILNRVTIRKHGQIHRHHHHILARAPQRAHQRTVAHAVLAIERTARPRNDMNDLHASSPS